MHGSGKLPWPYFRRRSSSYRQIPPPGQPGYRLVATCRECEGRGHDVPEAGALRLTEGATSPTETVSVLVAGTRRASVTVNWAV